MLALFFHVAALYLFLNAEFLAAVQVILYCRCNSRSVPLRHHDAELESRDLHDPFIGEWPVSLAIGSSLLLLIFFTLRDFLPGPVGTYTIEMINGKPIPKSLEGSYTQSIFSRSK